MCLLLQSRERGNWTRSEHFLTKQLLTSQGHGKNINGDSVAESQRRRGEEVTGAES